LVGELKLLKNGDVGFDRMDSPLAMATVFAKRSLGVFQGGQEADRIGSRTCAKSVRLVDRKSLKFDAANDNL
jgi:hypothetical protein